MDELFERLRAPFPPDAVSWRVGSTNKRKFEEEQKRGKTIERKGQALAFIDARDVMNRFDNVLGPQNWTNRYVPMPNGTTCCEIAIRVGGEWLLPKSSGAGATGDVSKEAEREMAEKGGYSDALKRAAVLWGVARYLYDLDSPWVRLDERWNMEKDELPRLRQLLERNGTPQMSAHKARGTGEYQRLETALRACVNAEDLRQMWLAEQKAIAALPDGWQDKLTEEKDRLKASLLVRAA